MEFLFILSVLCFGLAMRWVIHERQERNIAKQGYQYYIKFSKRWKQKRNECYRRFGYRCAVCNSPTDLNAHHRTYIRLFNERQEDLTCLCRNCHELFSLSAKLYKK